MKWTYDLQAVNSRKSYRRAGAVGEGIASAFVPAGLAYSATCQRTACGRFSGVPPGHPAALRQQHSARLCSSKFFQGCSELAVPNHYVVASSDHSNSIAKRDIMLLRNKMFRTAQTSTLNLQR